MYVHEKNVSFWFVIRQACQNIHHIFSTFQRDRGGYYENEKLLWNKYGISPIHVHTSGHASVTQLKEFASALKPTTIIPVHTISPTNSPTILATKSKYFLTENQQSCKSSFI